MVMPGEDANINLRMNKQMTFTVGQQFTIRSAGATIASGKVKPYIKHTRDIQKYNKHGLKLTKHCT